MDVFAEVDPNHRFANINYQEAQPVLAHLASIREQGEITLGDLVAFFPFDEKGLERGMERMLEEIRGMTAMVQATGK